MWEVSGFLGYLIGGEKVQEGTTCFFLKPILHLEVPFTAVFTVQMPGDGVSVDVEVKSDEQRKKHLRRPETLTSESIKLYKWKSYNKDNKYVFRNHYAKKMNAHGLDAWVIPD